MEVGFKNKLVNFRIKWLQLYDKTNDLLPFLLITALMRNSRDDQNLTHVTSFLALNFLNRIRQVVIAVVFLSIGHER